MKELSDEFFKRAGFDVSNEPFIKVVADGVSYVYRNYARDGSGRYDGYIVIKPASRTVRTIEDYRAAYEI